MTSTAASSPLSDDAYAPDFGASVSPPRLQEARLVGPEPAVANLSDEKSDSLEQKRSLSSESVREGSGSPPEPAHDHRNATSSARGQPSSDFAADTYGSGQSDDENSSIPSSPESEASFKRVRPEDDIAPATHEPAYTEDPDVTLNYPKFESDHYFAYPVSNTSRTSLPRRGPERVYSSLGEYLDKDSVFSPPPSRYVSPPGRRFHSAPSERYTRRSSWGSVPQQGHYPRPVIINNREYGDEYSHRFRNYRSPDSDFERNDRTSRSRPRSPYVELEDPKLTSTQQENQLLKDRLIGYSQRLQALTENVAALESRLAQSLERREISPSATVIENGNTAPATLVGVEDHGPHFEDLAEKQGLAASIPVKRNSERFAAASEARKSNPIKSEDFVWEQPKSTISHCNSTCELSSIDAIERWVDEMGRQRSTIFCPEGPRAKTIDVWSLQLRWLHIQQPCLDFDFLERMVTKCPFISVEMIETTLLTLRSARDKFSQNHEGRLYLQPGAVLRQTGVFNDRENPNQTEPVVFLASPYLTLEPFVRRPKSSQVVYAQTLLQSLYRYDAGEERERRQVVQKTYKGIPQNEILHVNQTWLLMIGSNILITVSNESAERLKASSLASDRGLKEDGDPITMRLIDEGNRRFNVILDPDASYADLLRHSVLVATGNPSQAHEYYITDLKGELFTPARWVQLMSSAKPEVQTFVLVRRQLPGKVLLPLPAPPLARHQSMSPNRQGSLSRETTYQGDDNGAYFGPPSLREQSSSISRRHMHEEYRSPSPHPSVHLESYFDRRERSVSRVSKASTRHRTREVVRQRPSDNSLRLQHPSHSPFYDPGWHMQPYSPTSLGYEPDEIFQQQRHELKAPDEEEHRHSRIDLQPTKRDYKLHRSDDANVITVVPPFDEPVTKKPRFALPPRPSTSASENAPSHGSVSTDRSSIEWFSDRDAQLEEKIHIANATIASRTTVPEGSMIRTPREQSRTALNRAAYGSLENVAEEDTSNVTTGRRGNEHTDGQRSRVRFGAGQYRPETWSLTLLNPRNSGEADPQSLSPSMLPFFSWRHSYQPQQVAEEKIEESLVKILNRVDSALRNQLQGNIYGSTFRCSRKDFMQRQRFHLQPPISTGANTPQDTTEARPAKVEDESTVKPTIKPPKKSAGFFSKAAKRTIRTTFSKETNKPGEEAASPTESRQSRETERSPQQIPTSIRASTYDHWLMVRFYQICRKLSSAFFQSNVGNTELHTVSLLYWGSIDSIFRQIKWHRVLQNNQSARKSLYVIHNFQKPMQASSAAGNHELKKPWSLCDTCTSGKLYSSVKAALHHLHEVHWACQNLPQRIFGDPCFAWIHEVTASPLESSSDTTEEEPLTELESFVEEVLILQETILELHSLVSTSAGTEESLVTAPIKRPWLPKSLIVAFGKIVQMLVLRCHFSARENQNLSLGRQLGNKWNKVEKIRKWENAAVRDAQVQLDYARRDIILMDNSSARISSFGVEPMGVEFLALALIENMQNQSLNLSRAAAGPDQNPAYLGLYQDYIAKLRYQAYRRPKRRVFLDIYDFEEELHALQGVVESQDGLIRDYIKVVSPVSPHHVNADRFRMFGIEEAHAQSQQARLRKRAEEIRILQDKSATLKSQVKQAIEILEEDHGKAIRVFTIVTLFFLPLSFVSTFLGMNTSDISDMEWDQTIFWATSIPITALVLVLAMAYGYRGDEITDWVTEKFEFWKDSLRRGKKVATTLGRGRTKGLPTQKEDLVNRRTTTDSLGI